MGCGGGLASESLARLGAFVTGVDPSASTLTVARGCNHIKILFLSLIRIISPCLEHSAKDPATTSISYVEGNIGTEYTYCVAALQS